MSSIFGRNLALLPAPELMYTCVCAASTDGSNYIDTCKKCLKFIENFDNSPMGIYGNPHIDEVFKFSWKFSKNISKSFFLLLFLILWRAITNLYWANTFCPCRKSRKVIDESAFFVLFLSSLVSFALLLSVLLHSQSLALSLSAQIGVIVCIGRLSFGWMPTSFCASHQLTHVLNFSKNIERHLHTLYYSYLFYLWMWT